MDVLFITKKRNVPGYTHSSFGLCNSAQFVANRLNKNDITALVVDVVDNNDIDRVVTQYEPVVVIIEALWVVPEKFNVLLKLHPDVVWIVRIHSKAPFLSMEGVAFKWLNEYKAIQAAHPSNFAVSCNNEQFNEELNRCINIHSIYLPNIYDTGIGQSPKPPTNTSLDIGCFGAIRPLKNMLIQAMAAVVFADEKGKHLRFHINAARTEQLGDNTLKNLRSLFAGTSFELVEHPWYPHEKFVTEIVPQMDIGMQVSLSESFNIVAADFADRHVPMVVSPEITWMPSWTKADPTSMDSIIRTLRFVSLASYVQLQQINTVYLASYNRTATRKWLDFVDDTLTG